MSPDEAAAVRLLFPPSDASARAELLRLIGEMPFAHDYWQHLKWLYKQAETAAEPEILGALMARLDAAPMGFEHSRQVGQVGRLALPATQDGSLAVANGWVCAALEKMLAVVDVRQPTAPALVAQFELHKGKILALRDGHAVILTQARQGAALQMIDLREPGKATCVGELLLGAQKRVEVVDWLSEHQLALWLDTEMVVVDLAKPALPRAVCQLPLKNGYRMAKSISLRDGYAYILFPDKLSIYDISDPAKAQVVGTLKGDRLECAGVCGELLLIVSCKYSWQEGSRLVLRVFDLTDPRKPVETASISREGACYLYRATSDFDEGQGVFTLWGWNEAPAGKLVVDVRNLHAPTIAKRSVRRQTVCPSAEDDRYLFELDQGELRVLARRRPSEKTIGYMKRRARRCLRKLSVEHPGQYLAVAAAMLRQSASAQRHLPSNWVTTEILYGGGNRLEQKRHGRGRLVLKPARWRRYRREELAPAAWDAAPGVAIDLLLRADLDWTVHECVYRQLQMRRRGTPVELLTRPGLLDEAMRYRVLGAFLASPSPWLIHGALAVLNQLKPEQDAVPARVAAAWCFYADGLDRQALSSRLARAAIDRAAFAQAFTELLAGYLRQAGGRGSRRLTDAARLLSRFPSEIPGNVLESELALLLESGDAHVRALGLAAIRGIKPTALLALIPSLAGMKAEARETALAAAASAVQGQNLEVNALLGLIYHETAWCREAGWRLVAAGADRCGVSVWSNVLYSGRLGEALRSALTSAEAMKVLCRVRAQMNMPDLFQRVFELVGHLHPDQRNAGAEAMTELAREMSFSKREIGSLLAPGDWWRQLAGWQFLAVSSTPEPLIAKELDRLLASPEATGAERVLSLPAVAALLRRLNDGLYLNLLLSHHPALLARLPAATLSFVLSTVSAEELVVAMQAARDEDWMKLREIVLRLVGRELDTPGFFHAMEQALQTSATELLAQRVLEDEGFEACFLGADSEEMLKLRAEEFDRWLVAWAERRAGRFAANSLALLTACTHQSPGLRAWGLARCEVAAMTLPFALRLVESELPDAVAHGKLFFTALPSGDEAELNGILALLDSPEPAVQAYGIELREARLAGAHAHDLLVKLGEHGHAHMRTYVASRLNEQPLAPAPDFDRRVLRRRRHAREAKELVKERLSEVEELDVALLKELAQSQCRRDAEWAWQQLGRLAAKGVEIEGVTTGEGVS